MTPKEFIEKQQIVKVEEFPNQTGKLNPLVSVCIETYNQEKYIAECIENVLNQETDFDYEILIGEDVSTDKTREICLEYANKYPKKIRLFLHNKENKFLFNGKITNKFNFFYNVAHARGKYIARCEGDDYWTNVEKIQIQTEFMEEKDLVFSFHGTQIFKNGAFRDYPHDDSFKNENIVDSSKFIEKGGGSYATASSMYKKELFTDIPNYFFQTGVIDLPLGLLAISKGKVGFISRDMAVYRKGNESAWSSNRDNTLNIEHYQESLDFVRKFDKETNFEHSKKLKRFYSNRELMLLSSKMNKANYLKKIQLLLSNLTLRNIKYNKMVLKIFMKRILNKQHPTTH